MESDNSVNNEFTFFENEPLTAHLRHLNLLDNKGILTHPLPELKTDGGTTDSSPNYKLYVISDTIIRAGKLLATGTMADVTFVVGPEKVQIPAHKFMLAAASQVFNTMFYGSIPEGEIVVMPEGTAEAFWLMLQYIYMGVIPAIVKADLGLELLDLARRYWLKDYENFMGMSLAKSLSSENALTILSAAILYERNHLEATCWKFIDISIREIISTPSFTSIRNGTLCKLVQRDSLQITEMDLFYGLITWGYAEMERRDEIPLTYRFKVILRPCLNHIRFPTMTATEFSNGPGRSGILTKEEIGEVLLYICSTGALKPACRWPKKPRPFNAPKTESDKQPEQTPAVLKCECGSINQNCLFCFGRDSNLETRSSSAIPRGLPGATRGRGRGVPPRRPLTAMASPIPYCPCKTRGTCPEKRAESDQQRPATVPVSGRRPPAQGYRSNSVVFAQQALRMEQERLLRREILDRQIQRNSRVLPG